MSYIIAYVAFEGSEAQYPVCCLRTDVKVGDAVVVRMVTRGGALKWASVRSVEFLNWDCQNGIECLASEAQFGPDGIILPPNSPITKGIWRPEEVHAHLYRTGWIPRKPKGTVARIAYTHTNTSRTANIFFRKNGADIQMLPREAGRNVMPNSPISYAPSVGEFVRNDLSHNKVNGLEQIIAFSDAFRENRSDYTKYMSFFGTGRKDHRIPGPGERSFEGTMYDLLGGSGGNVYLGDGLSLSPSGGWVND
ncbi:hypothetical protein [Microvirga splendida]|uniref:Uncharacterized protein n=1 Tax=Microvirga splendida TaxID=2795727 RepID=A0ABS0XZB2_9HYPH|nr:hypothetical protein [Microvirga splendida]MBJ6125387.1 hypothetical protein [Microvirga splendida]